MTGGSKPTGLKKGRALRDAFPGRDWERGQTILQLFGVIAFKRVIRFFANFWTIIMKSWE